MKRFIKICCLVSFVALISCKPSNKEIYSELERFDSSLDSLITEEIYDEIEYLIFQGDTLKNSPVLVEETCYQIIGSDSIKVDANGHTYRFDKCHLLLNSSEDFLGNKFVQKFIYFRDKIDNEKMESLRRQKSDTIYFGRLRKYNAAGYLIKSVESYESRDFRNDGSSVVTDYRLLQVYRYNDDNTITTWTKRYFDKTYNVDSLKSAKIIVSTSPKDDFWEADKINYSYTLDEYGNWIVKRKKVENPDVYYRKYTY